MLRNLVLAGALALGLLTAPACADSFTDAGGTATLGSVDVSRTAHAAVQCAVTVTAAAAALTTLWAGAGCSAFPSAPQFAFVMPTGGAIYYRTDGVTPSSANGWPIFQNQAWPVEGRLSIVALQLVASGNVSTMIEVRY